MSDQQPSFWSTLPGVLTAFAGLIAAVSGLITVLFTAGVLGNSATEPSKANNQGGDQLVDKPIANINASDVATEADSEKVVSLKKLDRTDAKATAAALIQAYKSRDVIALASLTRQSGKQIFGEMAAQGTDHPRYDSIFGDDSWRWQAAKSWNGTLGETRYRHFVGAKRDEFVASVKFGELSQNEILTVVLTWENGKWSWEDINSPDSEEFATGKETFSLGSEPY